MSKTILALLIICPLLLSCGGTSGQSFFPAGNGKRILIDFARTGTGDYTPFSVKITPLNESWDSVAGLTMSVASTRGSVGAVTDNGDGTYECTVTPGLSGEYRITAKVMDWDLSAVKTAIVLKKVHSDWGQPQPVPGDMINTGGWEDSINITPDGEWLFLMYSPMSFGGMSVSPSHLWAKNASGPWEGPVRPDFPRGRISDKGEILHWFPLFCYDPFPPMVVQPTAMYGFKKLSDGTFGNPFLISIIDETNNDTMIQHGPHIAAVEGKNLMVFNFNDPGLGGTKNRVYAVTIAPGEKTILGRYYSKGCPSFDKKDFLPELVPLEEPGGTLSINDPHVWADSGGPVKSIWAWKQGDDKDDSTKKIYVYVLKSGTFPGIESDWDTIELPAPINTGPTSDMQPHFTGDRLYYYRDGANVVAQYKGGNYGDVASWGSPETLLESGFSGSIGEIIVVGEPTVCDYKGKKALYFVYGVVEAQDGSLNNINFNAGFVEKK